MLATRLAATSSMETIVTFSSGTLTVNATAHRNNDSFSAVKTALAMGSLKRITTIAILKTTGACVAATHASDPDTSLNFPAAQCVQGPPLGPVEPGLQVQTALPVGALEFVGHIVHAVAPTAPEYELTAQATQGPAPVAFLNFPTSQGVQIPPITPE